MAIVFCFIMLYFTLSFNTAMAGIPIRNSNPDYQPVIYLDFDGAVIENTAWNYNGPIICGSSGLTDVQGLEIYNRVAEDYSPFTINVTTDSNRYWSAPPTQRIRVIISVSSSWYGSAGGVAFTGSFTWGDNTPCFVFSQLLNYNTKYIAEAVSHESGHTLGLYHQAVYDTMCTKLSDYNYGMGSGEIGWAPIMGIGYYQNMTRWHNGPNPYGCTNLQDDIAIITSTSNGISTITDDCDSSFLNAPFLNFSNPSNLRIAKLESNGDVDLYRFNVGTNRNVIININPGSSGVNNAGGNIDLIVSLYNSNKELVSTFNDPQKLNVTIDTMLSPGDYFLSVSAGANNYAALYGSVGTYSLHGTLLAGSALPVKNIRLTNFNTSAKVVLAWITETDLEVTRQWLELKVNGTQFVKNNENIPANGSYEYYFLASDKLIEFRVGVQFSDLTIKYSNIVAATQKTGSTMPEVIMSGSQIYVRFSEASELTVTDIGGRIIARQKLNSGLNNIKLFNHSTGIHLFIITNSRKAPFINKIFLRN
ncbi:MAG: DVUA0089 family protein [Bacteroidetes bacterium]|nr:DVUA0089 family protein [Bacteroidota bacterium]